MPPKANAKAIALFQAAVGAAEHLHLKSGLNAVKATEGGGQLQAVDSTKILGSVEMDGDCRAAYPQSARWDYVIGYDRAGEAVAYFVEVHSADTSQVSKMERKLEWLLQFLDREPQAKLSRIKREIHWVASHGINIPKHLPQYRRLNTMLRKRGLQGPVKHLTLA